MRVLAAALAVLLLVAICSLAEADLTNSRIAPPIQKQDVPHICCYSYISRPIPLKIIHSAYRTSSSCPTPSVILVTRKGRQLCADPKAFWVQKLLELLPEH